MPVTRKPPSSGAPLKRTDNRMLTHNLQIRVRRPPSQPSDLELIEAPEPTLTNGAFLARTLWLALDPFVCAPDAAAHDAVKPGDLVPAHGVGEVIESRHEVFGVGSLVVLECGLQQLCVSDGRHARLLHSGRHPPRVRWGCWEPRAWPPTSACWTSRSCARERPCWCPRQPMRPAPWPDRSRC